MTRDEIIKLHRYARHRAYAMTTPLHTPDDYAQEAVMHVLRTNPPAEHRAIAAVRRMQDLRRTEQQGTLSVRGYRARLALNRTKARLEQTMLRAPTAAELVQACGLSWEDYAAAEPPAFDTEAEPTNNFTPLDELETERRKRALRAAVMNLPGATRAAAQGALYRGETEGGRHSKELQDAVKLLRRNLGDEAHSD